MMLEHYGRCGCRFLVWRSNNQTHSWFALFFLCLCFVCLCCILLFFKLKNNITVVILFLGGLPTKSFKRFMEKMWKGADGDMLQTTGFLFLFYKRFSSKHFLNCFFSVARIFVVSNQLRHSQEGFCQSVKRWQARGMNQ
jgi:hypothetical protein